MRVKRKKNPKKNFYSIMVDFVKGCNSFCLPFSISQRISPTLVTWSWSKRNVEREKEIESGRSLVDVCPISRTYAFADRAQLLSRDEHTYSYIHSLDVCLLN